MTKTKPLLLLGIFIFLVSCNHVKPGQIDFNSFGVTTDTEIATGMYSLEDRMEIYNVPGVSITVVLDGKLEWAKGYGIANSNTGYQVETNTLFQAASISKSITALAILTLLENNQVDLDEDVNVYLKDWKVTDNKYTTQEKVTLRRLLTHTAGINVHGFPGYRQDENFPELEAVLNGEGNTSKILVDAVPGSSWRYSGGGYTIIQKVIEDVSGLSFQEYMDTNILTPLYMTNSTFHQPLPSSLHNQTSAAYYRNGDIIEGLWHNYPERAAAGLWTTPTDLAKYIIEIQNISSGTLNGFLSKDTVDLMLTPYKNDWGLGLQIVNDKDPLIFQHNGKNAGFTNTMGGFVSPKNGLSIMTNGDNGGNLIQEIYDSISNHYGW